MNQQQQAKTMFIKTNKRIDALTQIIHQQQKIIRILEREQDLQNLINNSIIQALEKQEKQIELDWHNWKKGDKKK